MVTTRSLDVARQALFGRLAALLPDVALVCGGRPARDAWVRVATADSLLRIDPDVDLVLCDEAHEAGSARYSRNRARLHRARLWGFSASLDCRGDGLDARVGARARVGPVRVRVSFAQAAGAGMVTPIRVVYRADAVGPADRDRWAARGLWPAGLPPHHQAADH